MTACFALAKASPVHQYQVSITPLDDELSDENNFDQFEVNVTRSEIKVLLADEMPRWEYRYLTQLFRRAPKIECDELLFVLWCTLYGRNCCNH